VIGRYNYQLRRECVYIMFPSHVMGHSVPIVYTRLAEWLGSETV